MNGSSKHKVLMHQYSTINHNVKKIKFYQPIWETANKNEAPNRIKTKVIKHTIQIHPSIKQRATTKKKGDKPGPQTLSLKACVT
jgi:ABC-type uncharacterized transport system substrate-binding protein